MLAPPSLLDSDILSEVMKKEPHVSDRAYRYLHERGQLTFSIITQYEILRGLKAKQAGQQIAAFDALCAASAILLLTDAIVVKAAGIYADLKQSGRLISDADILIAATAMVHNLILVSNNVEHFSRITGLKIDNWKIP